MDGGVSNHTIAIVDKFRRDCLPLDQIVIDNKRRPWGVSQSGREKHKYNNWCCQWGKRG